MSKLSGLSLHLKSKTILSLVHPAMKGVEDSEEYVSDRSGRRRQTPLPPVPPIRLLPLCTRVAQSRDGTASRESVQITRQWHDYGAVWATTASLPPVVEQTTCIDKIIVTSCCREDVSLLPRASIVERRLARMTTYTVVIRLSILSAGLFSLVNRSKSHIMVMYCCRLP